MAQHLNIDEQSAPSAERVAALAALDAEAGPHPWTLVQLQSRIAAGDRLWLALGDDRARGFALFNRVLDEASLLNIAVERAAQGQGIARQLLTAALRQLATEGVARCFLEVRASNEPAQRLYRRLGFAEIARRDGYYPAADGRRETAIVMCCDTLSAVR